MIEYDATLEHMKQPFLLGHARAMVQLLDLPAEQTSQNDDGNACSMFRPQPAWKASYCATGDQVYHLPAHWSTEPKYSHRLYHAHMPISNQDLT